MADKQALEPVDRHLRDRISLFVFGRVAFTEDEEFQAFRYKLLIVLMLAGAVFTALFLLGNATHVNPITGWHLWSMTIFTSLALIGWLCLRGHPARFDTLAWPYAILCLLEYTSALVFVPVDELRVLWFYLNVPGVFILLGQRAGWGVTLGTAIGLLVVNPWLEAPYSSNAMATAVLSLLLLGVMFHVFVDRSTSFYLRMRAYNRDLKQLASHDPLTGVLNARAYYAACDQQISLSQRRRSAFSVLFIDLDHFKRINDTYGHATGDEVLKQVALTLRQHIRRTDLLGRIGGEEFSILLHDTARHDALRLAESLRQAIESCRPHADGHPLTVTASIGVAVSPEGQESMLPIQEHADAAMYQAKQAGRNRVTAFN